MPDNNVVSSAQEGATPFSSEELNRLRKAASTRESREIGSPVEELRFGAVRRTYAQIHAAAQSMDPTLDAAEWDALLFEADELAD